MFEHDELTVRILEEYGALISDLLKAIVNGQTVLEIKQMSRETIRRHKPIIADLKKVADERTNS